LSDAAARAKGRGVRQVRAADSSTVAATPLEQGSPKIAQFLCAIFDAR
jgi:hypothetical protein